MTDGAQAQEWAVTFTYVASSDEATIDKIADGLDHFGRYDGTIAAMPPDRVTVTLHVPASGADEAVVVGQRIVMADLDIGEMLGGSHPVAATAMTESEHKLQANAPTMPELVGASEVAELLRVSRQRVHQLRDRPDFPAPLVEVAMGPLWDARAVEAFAREWNRRPGRPRIAVAQ